MNGIFKIRGAGADFCFFIFLDFYAFMINFQHVHVSEIIQNHQISLIARSNGTQMLQSITPGGLDRCHFKSLFRSQSKLYRAFYIVINMSLSPYLFNVFIICTKAES